MRPTKEGARYNVVSLRVSDEEKLALEEVVRKTRMSTSEVLREAVAQLRRRVEHGSGLQ